MTAYSKYTGEKVGGTVIGANSHIGTATGIGPGAKIAPNTTIGAIAYVAKDCEEPGIYVGIPAKKK